MYLAGNKFTVASGHRSLEVLESSKINNGRLARILEQLSEFDFKIEYNEGTSPIITVADALSRLPRYRKVLEEDPMDDNVGEISNIDTDDGTSTELEKDDKKQLELFEVLGLEEESDGEQHREKQWGTSVLVTDEILLQEIKENYRNDQELWGIIKELEKKEGDKNHTTPKQMVFKTSNYRWDSIEKLLFRKIAEAERLCIPKWGTLRLNRLLEAHDIPLGGHFGREKTLANLAKNFFWPGMTKDVEDFVKSCNNCQRNKSVRRAPIGLLYPHDRPQARWEKIALDFIVQLPKTRTGKFDAILTVVDFCLAREERIS